MHDSIEKLKRFPLHILQADLLTRDETQRHHSNPYKYILHAICVFSCYAYAIPLRSKRCDEVAKDLESIFEQDSYRKIIEEIVLLAKSQEIVRYGYWI